MRKLLLDIQSKYKDNWDGAGAKQPNDLAIRRADIALDTIGTLKMEASKVVPSVESGIGICFTNTEGRYADLEIFNDGDACLSMFLNGVEFLIEGVAPRGVALTRWHMCQAINKINLFMHGLLDPALQQTAA